MKFLKKAKKILTGKTILKILSFLIIVLNVSVLPLNIFVLESTQKAHAQLQRPAPADDNPFFPSPTVGPLRDVDSPEMTRPSRDEFEPTTEDRGLLDQSIRIDRDEGAHSLDLLYPRALPQRITPEDIGVDFISCIAGIMAARMARQVFNKIAVLGHTIQNSISDFNKSGGSFWTFGHTALSTGAVSISSTIDREESLTRDGIRPLDFPVLPGGDDIVFCAKQVAFAYLSATVIHWINTAFNEGAIWVEDLAASLSRSASLSFKRAIGDVNLCVDLEASVALSLDLSFLKTQPVAPRTGCTISINERRDLELMFQGLGHDPVLFNELYANPMNNAMGSFLMADYVARKYTEHDQNIILTELSWNDGWWPFKIDGRTVTPGAMVRQKVIDVLKLPSEHEALTSNWDQAIFMITNQLVKNRLQRTFNPLSM